MTQAFCQLVLHYSISRLSWKTIKSLRRSRSRLRRAKKCDGGDIIAPPTTRTDSGRKNDDGEDLEYEILQGWTILAFHSLYVSLGIEYLVRFVIPFYFHMKMIALIATFVVPSWSGRNGGGGDGSSDFGLSPLISYCFDYLIVPGVHRVHNLMDQDPKGWALRQLAMIPFWIIDYFILPGILTSEEEKQLILETRRREDKMSAEEDVFKAPPSGAFPPPTISDSELSSDPGFGQPAMLIDEDTTMRENNGGSQSQSAAVQIASDAKQFQKQHDESKSMWSTPPRSEKLIVDFGVRTPTTSSTNRKPFALSLSPAVKSRLASSAMRLKRFSNEHRRNGGLLSPEPNPPAEATDAKGDDASKEEAMSPPRKWFGQQSAKKTRRRRRERLSFGDHFRELVTGDANVRVRDHLFDLDTDLPSTPRRRLRPRHEMGSVTDEESKSSSTSTSTSNKKNNNIAEKNRDLDFEGQGRFDGSNVTTRRSSRLAKKKASSSH
mmetsp:Transcript_16533/g.34924  ORF Transcript_16533/g.34924 Transcript_16533/m.34924 type:complete len:492 (+) Transcript_16533:45-1520(+)